MLQTLVNTLLRAQFGDVRRKTRGALLEVAALGMAGLSIVLLFIGVFLWLSLHMEPWLAAMALAGFALLVAILFLLIGRALLRRRKAEPDEQIMSTLKAFGLVSNESQKNFDNFGDEKAPGTAFLASALMAGLVLGRSINR